MPYTSQGYMTAVDMQDMRELYDLDAWKDEINPECHGHADNEGDFPKVSWCTFRDECPDAEA